MKIALVHDYLTQRGGAERVFELMCQHFPTGTIYTSLYSPETTVDLGGRKVHTTFLQWVPLAKKYFRLFAPFYFAAFRSLDLREYDLILSSSASFAKVVRKRPDAKHICFCHNVTRFLWDTDTYLREYDTFRPYTWVLNRVFDWMRAEDVRYAQEPDLYIANSTTVQGRIEKIYQQPAITINYPIDTSRFSFSDQKEDFYLAASRLLSYKKIDVIVEAFNHLGLPLYITGDGPEIAKLRALAQPNVQFLGYVSDSRRCELLTKAKGVIVAALEDYGLVPVEANASGTPVLSYGAGGVLDTQIDGVTGVFFESQTADALCNAVKRFETMTWDYHRIHEHAVSKFSEQTFFQQVDQVLAEVLAPKSS